MPKVQMIGIPVKKPTISRTTPRIIMNLSFRARFEFRCTVDRGGSWLLVADLPRDSHQRSDRLIRVMRATYPPGEVA
jgi:hypothetical protein